jgi:hypothetical protein
MEKNMKNTEEALTCLLSGGGFDSEEKQAAFCRLMYTL